MVKQSHVALELLFASKTSHHSHSFQQRRTPSNSHEKRRTGAIGPCTDGGLVKEGKHYFDMMQEYNLEPEIDHYVTVVDLYIRRRSR